MTVWEYFAEKEQEFARLSLIPLEPRDRMFMEEAGSNGRRGHVLAALMMTERATLHVHEKVLVVGKNIRREEYAYYLVFDDDEVCGYDRDPSHTPAEHGHFGRDHKRREVGRVTFKKAAEEAWDVVTYLEG